MHKTPTTVTLQQHYSPCFHLHMLVNLCSQLRTLLSLVISSLTDGTSSSCISLKVTKYKPNAKSLSAVMQ